MFCLRRKSRQSDDWMREISITIPYLTGVAA